MSSTRPAQPLPPPDHARTAPAAAEQRRDSHGDVVAGGLFVVVGGAFAVVSAGYGLGTWREMGAGMYPFVLGVTMAVLGVAIVVKGFRGGEATEGLRRIPWRAVVCIGAALVFFALSIDVLGLLVAAAGAALLSCLASPTTSLLKALLATVGITAACYVVFVVALQLRLPLLWF
jgi:uncharacterized membrane protein